MKSNFDRIRALELRAEGKGIKSIANELGATAETVRAWLRKKEGPPSAEVIAQIKAQLAERKTPHQIAAHLRVNPAIVLAIRDTMAAERPPPVTATYPEQRAAELLKQGFTVDETASMTKLDRKAVVALKKRGVAGIDRSRRPAQRGELPELKLEDFMRRGGEHPT